MNPPCRECGTPMVVVRMVQSLGLTWRLCSYPSCWATRTVQASPSSLDPDPGDQDQADHTATRHQPTLF